MDSTDAIMQMGLTQEEYPGLFMSLSKERTLSSWQWRDAAEKSESQSMRGNWSRCWWRSSMEGMGRDCQSLASKISPHLTTSKETRTSVLPSQNKTELIQQSQWVQKKIYPQNSPEGDSSLPLSWFLDLWDSRSRPIWATWKTDFWPLEMREWMFVLAF